MFSVSSLYLEEKYREFLQAANTTYFGLCILKDGESGSRFQKQLSVEVEKIYEAHKSGNYKASKEECEKVLQGYLENLNDQLADRYSMPEGKGLQNLCDDITKMEAEWSKKELGPAKEKAFKDFEDNEVGYSKAIEI